ncbi:hypothetical protein PG993_005574 [Apiospora rasikravindrae]|uniref:N-acetyltransferase domain-containing protein n=1 Tax=Apiospora rasikravindrae TaxID=990691 RepID=A0ABR1TFY9_9PEZI
MAWISRRHGSDYGPSARPTYSSSMACALIPLSWNTCALRSSVRPAKIYFVLTWAPRTSGVDTEPEAERSHSVVRMQMMMNPGNLAFAITIGPADDESAIGFIGITRPPEIFFIFSRVSWGKGYATEALEAFLTTYWSKFPNGLQQMGYEHKDLLQAYVVEENAGSCRVLEKAGFKQIGTAVGKVGDRKDVLERVYEIRRPTG